MSFNTIELKYILRERGYLRGPFGSALKRAELKTSGVPVYEQQHAITGARSFRYFIDDEKYQSLKRFTVEVNDLIISCSGTVGRISIINSEDPKGIISQALLILRPNTEVVTPYFLYYFLISEQGQREILNASQGAVQLNIAPRAVVEKIPVPAPTIEEQDEIVSVLRSVDDKIALNTQTNQTLEQIAQALFKSWFVDFDPVKAKMAALAAGGTVEEAELEAMSIIAAKSPEQLTELKQTNPEAYKKLAQTAALFPSAMQDSELGEIPQGWSISTIEQSFKVVMGQSPKGDTYNENKEGALFYQGRAEFGWRFPSPRLYTTEPKRMASKGDVLMSVRAPVGDLNIAIGDCCVGRGLCSLLHNSDSTAFSYYLLKSLQKRLNVFNGEGTVFGSINQRDLKSIQFISPTLQLVGIFVVMTTPLDESIESLSLEMMSLSSLRDSLLPKLFSGEVNLSQESVYDKF